MIEFEIPLLSDASRQAAGATFSRTHVNELIEECRHDFDGEGAEAVIKRYSLLHSVVKRFDEIDICVREQYWLLTLQALEALCQELGMSDLRQLDAEKKKQLRNAAKMLSYIAVRMVELYEREPSPSKKPSTVRKKKSQSSSDEPRVVGGVPAGGKVKLVCLLSQLLEVEVVQLWEPPSPQMMDNWSSLIAQLCFKLLENGSISKDQVLLDRLVHLLGILVRDYGQALSVSVKVIQLLQHFDHLVSPLAKATARFSTQFNCKKVTTEVVRELGGKDPRDLAVDSSGTRSFATFLVELSHLVPDCVLLCVSVLLPHLNGESYTFRNGVLAVITEILIYLHQRALSDKHQLINTDNQACLRDNDDEAHQLRDSLFIKLEEHIHDTNAFVRVKVLQLLLHLVKLQATPLPRVHGQVVLVAGRLRDKSSSVRKNALQLLSTWLTHNPFSGKLDETEFQRKLSEEQSHLSRLVGEGECTEKEGGTEVLKQAVVVNYYTDAVRFISALQDCVPITTQLLGSKVASDVLEALDFLRIAQQFNLSQTSEGLRRALMLIWSRDENIRKALINTYIEIYFTVDPKLSQHQHTALIVDNLLLLTQQSSAGELASLHQLVGVLVRAGHIPSSVVKALLELCTGSNQDKARLASCVLVMASAAQPSIVSTNLDVLVETGFAQPYPSPDLIKAKYVCQAIQNLASSAKSDSGKQKGKEHSPFKRFSLSHSMFSEVHSLLVNELPSTDSQHWCPLAQETISMAYKLSDQPDKFVESLLKDFVKQIFSSSLDDVNSHLLSRLLFCVGHVALLQMVHCELVVAMEIKNKRAAADTSNRPSRKSLGGDDGLELTGASADDTDAELIRRVLETEVGGAGGLLVTFEPMIVGIVSNPLKYDCPALQTSACLALAKYMLISSAHCEKYLQLFFTVLDKSTLECVRANTVIAASDLACRFPNLLEPWTPYIYARLTDHAPLVRHNALTVLTHLILNDMIKVRGQISSVARCLEDSDTRIAELAKLFFHELAKKGNALYNVLPDIISHMSDPSSATPTKQSSFQITVKFLFGFIQKDRLCESLIEKLCHRFRAARSNKQVHDLAYCLTLLPASERTLRKLQENLPCYQDKLVDSQVYSSFTTIMNKMKKLSKPDVKSIVEEFEQCLHHIHTKGLTDDQGKAEEEQEGADQQQDGSSGSRVVPTSFADTDNNTMSCDFSSDVLTSARKQLISATPTTPLSQKTALKAGHLKSTGKHHPRRIASESSDSEVENEVPASKLNLNLSSGSPFH